MEETVKCNLEKLGKSIFMGEGKAWLGGRDREKRGAGGGAAKKGGTSWKWFSVLVAENGFSKYSGKIATGGRNRPRFAIQAHCGLLVTSMSPNC